MPLSEDEDQFSDNEIFFGKLSLKEFKKHILWNNREPSNTNACATPVTPADPEKSLQIIQMHSQPNIRQKAVNSAKFSSLPGSPGLTNDGSPVFADQNSQESFLQAEDVVEKLRFSSAGPGSLELNNTLEVIDYILNNGPNMKTNNLENKMNIDLEKNIEPEIDIQSENYVRTEIDFKTEKNIITEADVETKKNNNTETDVETKNNVRTEAESDIETEKVCLNSLLFKSSPLVAQKSPIKNCTPLKKKYEEGTESPKYFTPVQSAKKHDAEVFSTPSVTLIKARTPLFRTPANPSSHKKPSALLLKTPGKTNAYQHITSPVASYIKKSPQVPLVKDVHPRKPLPGPSFIPKFVKNPYSKAHNKENVNLPSIAYKSAKKTKVIDVPDEERLPQSQWAKKITSTLPRPTVMKHEIRNKNIFSENLFLTSQQEDSFGNLSCVQADVSVCTQKTAFKNNRK